MFQIETLDHVALRVRDIEASAKWYKRVLGLKAIQAKEWGPFPIIMVAENQTGIALFPTRSGAPETLPDGDWIKGDHYAFRVDQENFQKAQEHLRNEQVPFSFQNHHYYHSIYFKDPDGHQLEITTLVKPI